MTAADIARIRANPSFQELVRRRSRLSWSLTVAMMLIYGAFVYIVAFDRSLASVPLGTGVITLAFLLGVGTMFAAVILMAFYVVRANGEFDRLTRAVISETLSPGDAA